MQYNVIIIGAGPAGLFAAQMISEQKNKICVLERNDKAGKKLLLSGSGQCNFTNNINITEFTKHYGDNGKFLNTSFRLFDNKACMSFFKQNGVDYTITESGKVFPQSMNSQDILHALMLKCQKNNVLVRYNSLVKHVSVCDNIFTVELNNGVRYFSKKLVFATGGQSYPKTGSDGIGFGLAKALGHTLVNPKPALTYIVSKKAASFDLSGISFKEIQAILLRDNKKIAQNIDSILFTHKGLSGPVILNMSRWIAINDSIIVNFLYPHSYEYIKELLAKEIPHRGKEEIVTYLKKYKLPKNFCNAICQLASIPKHTSCSNLTKKQREDLVNILTRCAFKVDSLGDLHVAMATAGGIYLKEINPTTMESRKHKGLYFVGEVLDIDGDTGGYNIQAAFSTAHLCSSHILSGKRNKKV